jgi:CRISPR-associated endonuclease/helicase Cas3
MAAPVIILSATLPVATRAQLLVAWGSREPVETPAEYPLVTSAPLESVARNFAASSAGAPGRRLRLARHPGLLDDADGIAALAVEAAAPGGCVCVLMNTVKGAQAVYRALITRGVPASDRFLFHARFRAGRRKAIEDEITARFGKDGGERRPRRAIVVATQVVEQSLDVDFDRMITQIAPIDLLLQRSGRLWRHDRGAVRFGQSQPVLDVLTPADGSFGFGLTGRVYDTGPEVLLRTLAVLRNRIEIVIPDDLRDLIEQCYGDVPWPDEAVPAAARAEARRIQQERIEQLRALATMFVIPVPSPDAFTYAGPDRPPPEAEDGEPAGALRVSTRVGGNTREAFALLDEDLQRDVGAWLAETERNPRWRPRLADLQRLYRCKVNLPAWWLPDASAGDVTVSPVRHWLHGAALLFMRDRHAATFSAQGKPLTIVDDESLGLFAENDTAENDAW